MYIFAAPFVYKSSLFAPSESASVTPQSEIPHLLPTSTYHVPFGVLDFLCLTGIHGAFHPAD